MKAVAMKPLHRHPTLVPLSHDHHHSLALCLRILRRPSENHQADIEPHLHGLQQHFLEEETLFAPHWHHVSPALRQRFEADHAFLRALAERPDYGDETWNRLFAERLRDHARFEERELFEKLAEFALLQAE